MSRRHYGWLTAATLPVRIVRRRGRRRGNPSSARRQNSGAERLLELVREGLSFAEIIRDYYPDLEPDDVHPCVQYAIEVMADEDLHLATAP